MATPVVALSACSSTPTNTGPRTTGPAPTSATTASAPTAAPSSSTAPPWEQLAKSLRGSLVRPGESPYQTLRLTPNPRYDGAHPLALLEAATEADVATGLRFATDHGLPVAVRSGGHSYAGLSAGDRRLVIDLRRLDQLSWAGTKATIGPGRQLADVYTGVAGRGRALPGGSCPTVGIGGLTLGGGVGVLTRAYGLTCDHLTAARIVLPDGRAVDADDDLLWSLRGGGAQPGIVTSLTLQTVAAPRLVTTYLTWPASRAAAVIPAWFDWIGDADARAWSTLKLLGGRAAHPDGTTLGATVTWVGPPSGFDRMLGPLLATKPAGRADHTRGYLEAMRSYAGSGAREAFAATSHVAYTPDVPVATLVDAVSSSPAALHEVGISIDALGGHVRDRAAADTAFVHRDALATVQYTATWHSGSPVSQAESWVRGTRRRLTPAWGDHGYVNYLDPTVSNEAYFGANWQRLERIRAAHDASGALTRS